MLHEFLNKLDEQKENVEFDISNLFKRTSMNIILNCAFGINPTKHENISEPFFNVVYKFLNLIYFKQF